MGGGGLHGYFGEQGLPVGIQECLERFHRGCVDYLSRQLVPKWDSPTCEGELAMARTASLLVELVGVNSSALVVETVGMVWVLGGLWDGKLLVTKWGELPMGRCSILVGLRSSSQRCRNPLTTFAVSFRTHLLNVGRGCLNTIFRMWPRRGFVYGEIRVAKDRFR